MWGLSLDSGKGRPNTLKRGSNDRFRTSISTHVCTVGSKPRDHLQTLNKSTGWHSNWSSIHLNVLLSFLIPVCNTRIISVIVSVCTSTTRTGTFGLTTRLFMSNSPLLNICLEAQPAVIAQRQKVTNIYVPSCRRRLSKASYSSVQAEMLKLFTWTSQSSSSFSVVTCTMSLRSDMLRNRSPQEVVWIVKWRTCTCSLVAGMNTGLTGVCSL